MGEVKDNKNVKFGYFVVRDNKLLQTKYKTDILNGETFCFVGTTPSTPPDVVLSVFKMNVDKLYNEKIREVVNVKYFNIGGIKNLILNIGEFKNWWE